MPPKCPDGKKGKKQPTKKQPAKSAAKKRGRAAKSVYTAQAASPPRESSPPLTPGRTDQRQTPDSPRSPNPPQAPLNPHTAPRSRRMAATATSSDTSDPGSHRSISNQSGSATSSVTSNISHPGPKKKKKRANRRECHIPQNQEDALVDWVREHECLWDSNQSDYRLKTKKDRLWQEKSEELGFSVNLLQTWFRSLRDIFTKLDKGKSGDGGVMTEREKWTKDSFAFLRKIVRHRPQAAGKSVKAIIAANKGDLSAAEAAWRSKGATLMMMKTSMTMSLSPAPTRYAQGQGSKAVIK